MLIHILVMNQNERDVPQFLKMLTESNRRKKSLALCKTVSHLKMCLKG